MKITIDNSIIHVLMENWIFFVDLLIRSSRVWMERKESLNVHTSNPMWRRLPSSPLPSSSARTESRRILDSENSTISKRNFWRLHCPNSRAPSRRELSLPPNMNKNYLTGNDEANQVVSCSHFKTGRNQYFTVVRTYYYFRWINRVNIKSAPILIFAKKLPLFA